MAPNELSFVNELLHDVPKVNFAIEQISSAVIHILHVNKHTDALVFGIHHHKMNAIKRMKTPIPPKAAGTTNLFEFQSLFELFKTFCILAFEVLQKGVGAH